MSAYSNSQLFQLCKSLSRENTFTVYVDFIPLPSSPRQLFYRAWPIGSLSPISQGLPFPENTPFEPVFAELLSNAYLTLSQASPSL